MNDKDYRYVVARCSQYHENYIHFIQHPNIDTDKRLWLSVMGLIETWDLIKNE